GRSVSSSTLWERAEVAIARTCSASMRTPGPTWSESLSSSPASTPSAGPARSTSSSTAAGAISWPRSRARRTTQGGAPPASSSGNPKAARARRAGRTWRSEALHRLQVDVARQQLDQVVLCLPPPRLADLHVGQVGEVASVDRAALEVRRAADDDPAHRAEILRLLEELVLEEDVATLALGEPQAHLHDALVLPRLVGRAEGDRHAREAADGAGEHEVGVALGDDMQRPMAAELV